MTDEEFEKAMADLGLCMQDLLQPANLTDLVVELTGVEDAVAIITNAGLSETLTDVIDYAKQIGFRCAGRTRTDTGSGRSSTDCGYSAG